MKRKSSMITFLLLTAFASLKVMADGQSNYWIAVNSDVVAQEISKNELKQILLTNQTTWQDGKKITIITLIAGTEEADKITNEFMGLSSVQAKKHWLTKVFGGVIQSVPKAVDSIDEAIEAVEKTPGAISVVPEGTKAGKVRIIQIQQ